MKLLTPEIARYYSDVNIEVEDIDDVLFILTEEELYRLRCYEEAIKENITNKRLFLFLCNLIDFSLKK